MNEDRPAVKYDIRGLTKPEIMGYIRGALTVDGERLRFEMSGYEAETGACVLNNLKVLNKFAHLGIYDYHKMLTIDFYKGSGDIMAIDWRGICTLECIGGYGTIEIIYKVLEMTVLTGTSNRRRS